MSITAEPDVRKLTWGMPIEQVRTIEGPGKLVNGTLEYERDLSGDQYIMALQFFHGKLLGVAYVKVVEHTSILSLYEKLLELMKPKYGEPHRGGDVWPNGPPGEATGMAIAMGDLMRGAQWNTKRTAISLIASRSGIARCLLSVSYRSVELQSAKEAEEAARAKSDL